MSKDNNQIPVWIAQEAMALMLAYAREIKKYEIGGLAKVDRIYDEGKIPKFLGLYVHSPVLLKQTVTSVEVNLDAKVVDDWLVETYGEDKVYQAVPTFDYCTWHSHGDMGVGFSAQDDEWYSTTCTGGFQVNIVVNAKGDSTARIDTLIGGTQESVCLSADLWIDNPASLIDVKTEIKDKVKIKTFEQRKPGKSSWFTPSSPAAAGTYTCTEKVVFRTDGALEITDFNNKTTTYLKLTKRAKERACDILMCEPKELKPLLNSGKTVRFDDFCDKNPTIVHSDPFDTEVSIDNPPQSLLDRFL